MKHSKCFEVRKSKTLALLYVFSILVFCSAPEEQKPINLEQKIDGNLATLSGKLVCIGCLLKKSDNAKAQCSVFGHKHGFQSNTEAIYSFIENDQSKEVISSDKYHNKTATIEGKVHHRAKMISLNDVSLTN